MICAPLIAVAELATAGALSTALSTALGSEILGGAVLGLIAAEGDPMGAVLGGIGGAVAGAAGGSTAAVEAGTETAASMTSELAAETVANTGVGATVDEISAAMAAGGENALGNIGDLSAAAAAGGENAALSTATTTDGLIGREIGGLMDRNGSDLMSDLHRGGPGGFGASPKGGGSIFDQIEDFAKKRPTVTRAALGAVQGVGMHLSRQDAIKSKYKQEAALEEERRRRAFSGLQYLTPFRVNPNYMQAGPIGRTMGAR